MTDNALEVLSELKASLTRDIEKLTERMVGVGLAIGAIRGAGAAKDDDRAMAGNGPIEQESLSPSRQPARSAPWNSAVEEPVKVATKPREPASRGRKKQPKEVRLDDGAGKAGRKRRDVRGEVLEALFLVGEAGATDRELAGALSSRGSTTVTVKQIRDAFEYHAKGNRASNRGFRWYHVDVPRVVAADVSVPIGTALASSLEESSARPPNGPTEPMVPLGRVIDALDEVGERGLCDDDLWDHQISKAEIMKAVTAGVVEIREGRYYAVPG
jgi:hypothetical protein